MRYIKLAVGSVLAVFALVMIAASGIGLMNYWTVCREPDPFGFPKSQPYISDMRQFCSNSLKAELLAIAVTVGLSFGAFLIIRYRGRRWLLQPRRVASSN